MAPFLRSQTSRVSHGEPGQPWQHRAGLGADCGWNWRRGMTAEEAVCSPSAGVEKLCFSEPSSVLTTAADAATATDGERGRRKPVPSWPAPSEPGLLPRSPARPLPRASVWRSHSALTTRLSLGQAAGRSSPGAASRLRTPLPRQAWLSGFRPAGCPGTGGSQPAPLAERLFRAHLCLEEPWTPCTLVTPGTGHEHTTDKFRRPPPSAKGTSHARSCGGVGRTMSGLAAPGSGW